MIDVLENKINELKVLDKGFVRLVDCMPRLTASGTADEAIVQAARVSYGSGTKSVSEDSTLIRYLMRHNHDTPSEMVVFKFHIKTPIFVARQFFRHRASSANEISGRYSIITDDFYFPELKNVREQSKINKQGGETCISEELAKNYIEDLKLDCAKAYEKYKIYIDQGVAREQARLVLPVNIYTEWYWSMNLRNLLHLLALRCDEHSQQETQQYARAMLSLIKNIVPITVFAWEDYHPLRKAMKLTALEIECLQNSGLLNTLPKIKTSNKREQTEWSEKMKILLGWNC